jgi:hypothetical protein
MSSEENFLRALNEEDTKRLMAMNQARGWLWMIVGIDYKHMTWNNFPAEWHAQYTDHHGYRTIVNEAVASKDMCIWYTLFGLPGF